MLVTLGLLGMLWHHTGGATPACLRCSVATFSWGLRITLIHFDKCTSSVYMSDHFPYLPQLPSPHPLALLMAITMSLHHQACSSILHVLIQLFSCVEPFSQLHCALSNPCPLLSRNSYPNTWGRLVSHTHVAIGMVLSFLPYLLFAS